MTQTNTSQKTPLSVTANNTETVINKSINFMNLILVSLHQAEPVSQHRSQ